MRKDHSLQPLTVNGHTIDTPLFLAPMAGITHSAFRRLVADFGGYGALFSEMLSGKALLHENVGHTPFTKRRPEEGHVWYQLLLNGTEDLPLIIERLKRLEPFALDLNCACPAPEIKRLAGGAALFADYDRLQSTLGRLRKLWKGTLTVKCRLGDPSDSWKELFTNRLHLFENIGVDALILHPRFSNEKLKRRARWELFPWIAEQTSLPVIANGDILSAGNLRSKLEDTSPLPRGIMIGRAAVVKPWIFRDIVSEPGEVDYLEVWSRYFEYVLEDFPPHRALGRAKEFTGYFARNFFFGHKLDTIARSSSDLETLRAETTDFLSQEQRIVTEITVSGL